MPVFLLIALGKALTRAAFFDADFARSINRLTYWVALPALLLSKISSAAYDVEKVSRISLLLILATIGSAVFAIAAAKLFRINTRSAGAFIQGSSRSNNAFVGLPVILYSMAAAHPEIETTATLSLAPAIVFYNIFSVSVLLAYSNKKSKGTWEIVGLFTKELFTNPLLLSCMAALLINFFGLRFPAAIDRSLDALGNTALALALLSIGSSLSFKGLGKGLPCALGAATIKVFIQPLIGYGIALSMGLPAVERQILLLYLACPTAVASYVLADIFDSDRQLAGQIIVLSTLLSAISLSLIVAFGGS